MSQGDRSSSIDFDTLVDHIADECLAVRVRVLSRIVTNIYDEALRPLGLRITQLNILVATGKLGTARPAELCQRLAMDASSLSRTLDRLASHGWIEFVPDTDRRARPFRLTSAGRDILTRARPAWEEAQRQAREQLGAPLASQLSSTFSVADRPAS
ncbi:MarR family transcriptional regulator [Maioricimonas sp. JC845]|uniref:MarR family winged helix-turn-helix transcriptional regulator n=1 Tax=Maioricimonas sp. JC845 TaxID=3232138 RepID=UPI0034578DC7